MKEQVLVVPRKTLLPDGPFQGLSIEDPGKILGTIESESFFMDREKAEEDPSHKQIIPYVVITREDQIFMVTRLSTQGEARLHQKVSIGIGGHINPEDSEGGKKPWEGGLMRELNEEISITGTWQPQLVGVLNDDLTPVGSVHFGLVYRVNVVDGEVEIREKDKMTGTFFAPEEVASFYNRMESWSQHVFAALWPKFIPLTSVTE